MRIADRLKKLRTERNWTQAQLAERLGIDQRNISRYETAAIQPTNRTLQRFADTFEMSLEELLFAGGEQVSVDDPELKQMFQEIASLPEAQRNAVKMVLEMICKQNRIQQMLAG